MFADTNVNGAVYTGSATVDACLVDCYRNHSCTAIDWNPTASVGRRCWLHHRPTGGSRNRRTGVHHLVIARPDCGGKHRSCHHHVAALRLGYEMLVVMISLGLGLGLALMVLVFSCVVQFNNALSNNFAINY